MKHENHTRWTATAAIAAALAFSTSPLAAQSIDAPAPVAPTIQIPPSPPVAATPAPTVVVPDVTAAPAVEQSAPDASEPAATGPSDSAAPVARNTHTTRTAVTRTTAVSHAAPVAAVAPPVAVTPPPANDIAPLPAQPVATTNTAVAPPPATAAEPTPTQTNNVIGTLGVALLGLLALAILAAGLLFFRRRHPVVTDTVEDPLATQPVVDEPIVEEAVAGSMAPATPMAAPTMIHRRDWSPVAGALPSNGAAVDLPAKLPETYEERTALFERMVNARPDKANPFTDRHARMRRARLIMQSLGVTFDREPRIDLSQYPNNWPELQRQYHKAA